MIDSALVRALSRLSLFDFDARFAVLHVDMTGPLATYLRFLECFGVALVNLPHIILPPLDLLRQRAQLILIRILMRQLLSQLPPYFHLHVRRAHCRGYARIVRFKRVLLSEPELLQLSLRLQFRGVRLAQSYDGLHEVGFGFVHRFDIFEHK